MPKKTPKKKAKSLLLAAIPIIAGLCLLTFGPAIAAGIYSLAIFDPQMVHSCDVNDSAIWTTYEGSMAFSSIDTADKVEGAGSFRVDYSGDIFLHAITIDMTWTDVTSRPILEFSMRVSTTTIPTPERVVVKSWTGTEYVDAVFYFPAISSTSWQTIEVDLRSPSSGSIDLTQIRYLTWWWEPSTSLSGQVWKLDNVRVGASSLPTPTPTPTPPSPTPTPPTPTPTPAPNEFQVTIAPSGTINMLVGENKIFTATMLNGDEPYTYTWFVNDAAQEASEGAETFNTGALPAGTYDVYLQVTDAHSQVATSNTATLIVADTLPTPTPAPPQSEGFIAGTIQFTGLMLIIAGVVAAATIVYKKQ